MRLVLMGPPGAGKGTQAKVLCDYLDVPHISTGDLFRDNIRGLTELGKTAQGFIDAGSFVPDEVTNSMVSHRLLKPDATVGFVLDGFPRTLGQVHALDEMLAESQVALDFVVELEVDLEVVVARLLQRAIKEERPDDTEAVIRHRLALYTEQTAPLIAHYASRGLLVGIDALGPVDEVRERLFAAVRT